MSQEEHPYVTGQRLIEEEFKSGKIPGHLARGEYALLPPDFDEVIRSMYFHHDDVKKTLDRMKKIGKVIISKKSGDNIVQEDITVDPSNIHRIPDQEEYPYYTRTLMMEHMKSLAKKLLKVPEVPEDTYSIYKLDSQPTAVFFRYPPKPADGSTIFNISDKFKIHLMFNAKYIDAVLHRLFNELIKNFIEARFPVLFKLVRYTPVTSAINQGGLPNPLFAGLKDYDYDYGVNSAEKKKYGRLAESFIYSPTEIKRYQVAFGKKDSQPKSSTFTLKGTTKSKDINERYDMETVFDPMIVFYTNDNPIYTRELLQYLLTIFPDETTQEWVLPNFYPRANVKINNMIYLANGNFDTKDNENMQCQYPVGGEPTCELDPAKGNLLDIPTEYQTIQDSCSRLPPDQCNAANRFSLAVSNHTLCKLEKVGNEEKCKPHKTYSQHLLLQDYESLEELYDALGQRAVLERFKAGTANGSLPNNYGGRRKTRKTSKRNKQSRKKNKSRRAH